MFYILKRLEDTTAARWCLGVCQGATAENGKATAKISIIYVAALFLATRLQLVANMVHF